MKIVFVADTHTGSNVGLAKPDWTVESSKGYEIRKRLYGIWEWAVSSKWSNPDVLIVDGDAADGQNTKSSGVGQWAVDATEQIDATAELLRMWGAKKTIVVLGSDYHVAIGNSGFQIEEWIGRKIAAEVYPNQENIIEERKEHSGWYWYVTVGGVTFHISHHISVSSVFHYRSTPIAREMLNTYLNDALRHEMGGQRTRIIIRAHAHYYWMCESSFTAGFILPCFQTISPYMAKKGLAISPDIGFLGMECENGEYRYEKHLWKLETAQRPPHLVIGGRDADKNNSTGTGGIAGEPSKS